ncbi:MAG: bifunctional riboflavin kinase/FAD synthetase [Crocinitomicaceae bacterium]
MKVYRSIEEIPSIKNPVVTLGTYDGVHLGHQEIISFLKRNAERIGGETVLFTFHPHPRMVLHPDDHGMKLIQSIDERISKLERFGIDHLILFPFTEEFSRLSATEFVRDILVNKINVAAMNIGYNHHFGRNREGNLELLKELGIVYDFQVEEIPAFRTGDISISSTKIRKAIHSGDLKTAQKYLGEAFAFKGSVVRGDQIGTKIGFPTANIEPESPNQIIPASGVYAVKVHFGNHELKGMMNIGLRPTVSSKKEQRLEVHLFDFNNDIYDEVLHITFIERIRDEQEFESLEALTKQLKNDQATCISMLA